MSRQDGYAQGHQLAVRIGAWEDEERGEERRRVHLCRVQPQAHETASRGGRWHGDVRQTAGGGPLQAAGIRPWVKQLSHGVA